MKRLLSTLIIIYDLYWIKNECNILENGNTAAGSVEMRNHSAEPLFLESAFYITFSRTPDIC